MENSVNFDISSAFDSGIIKSFLLQNAKYIIGVKFNTNKVRMDVQYDIKYTDDNIYNTSGNVIIYRNLNKSKFFINVLNSLSNSVAMDVVNMFKGIKDSYKDKVFRTMNEKYLLDSTNVYDNYLEISKFEILNHEEYYNFLHIERHLFDKSKKIMTIRSMGLELANNNVDEIFESIKI
jgi:hypothetical protein